MRMLKRMPLLACLLLLQNYLSAQDKLNIKFGKVTPADFDLSKYSFDTSASAVIIALHQRGVTCQRLRVDQPSLDDAFIALTGDDDRASDPAAVNR